MGNMQQQQPRPANLEQEEANCDATAGGSSTLDKEMLFRFLGLRMANEGDGYELPATEHLQAKETTTAMLHDDETKQMATWRNMGVAALSALGHHGLQNPGTVADLHYRCHDMLPQTFDGFRLNICRSLSSQVSVAHALQLGGKSGETDCQFSASYTIERGSDLLQKGATQQPLIVAELDTKGNLNATLTHFMTQRLRGKLSASFVDSQLQNTRIFLDYFGSDYTCSCVLSNFKLDDRTGVVFASYLQQMTPSLALGMDLIYQREDIVPGGQAAMVSAVARYHQDSRIWSAVLSMHTLEICFTQLYGQNLGASVQLQANVLERHAISRLCYHCHLPKIGFNFRGGIDTHGVISAVCERQLEPFPVLLQFSAKLNHLKNRFRFGLGVVID